MRKFVSMSNQGIMKCQIPELPLKLSNFIDDTDDKE